MSPATDDATLRFRACVDEVLRHEGGYVDHPRDPGGCTNFGITRATLEAWRERPTTCSDVRTLSVLEARQIYRARYWNAVAGDALPAGIDLAVFDAGVNSGPRRATQWLQAAVGAEQDGAIGPLTILAARSVIAATAIEAVCSARLAYLRSLATWGTFGRGWSRRVQGVRAAALKMAGAA